MEGDRPIAELLPEIEAMLDEDPDILVFLKWSCPLCGERVMDDVPNRYCARGYKHTHREDGSACGAVYYGHEFGYAIVLQS